MEQLVQKGLVRSIGMSNFSRRKLKALLAGGVTISPAVLQVRGQAAIPAKRQAGRGGGGVHASRAGWGCMHALSCGRSC
jgi:hypothetical protein